jgi:hypothetical protein
MVREYGLSQIRNSEISREILKAHLCVQRVGVGIL